MEDEATEYARSLKDNKTDIVRLYDAQTGEELELGRDEEIGHRFSE